MDELKDWNTVCQNSIRKEKAEIGKRYNIRFGQTEIYCGRCGKSCIPGHRCMGIKEPQPILRLPNADSNLAREWKWCESKQQRICDEVCWNNLHTKKCEKTSKECRVKKRPMSEEAKVLLRSLYAKRGRPRKGSPNGKRTPELCEKIKTLGVKKVATMLYQEDRRDGKGRPIRDISERAVKAWIYRETVPLEYHEAIQTL